MDHPRATARCLLVKIPSPVSTPESITETWLIAGQSTTHAREKTRQQATYCAISWPISYRYFTPIHGRVRRTHQSRKTTPVAQRVKRVNININNKNVMLPAPLQRIRCMNASSQCPNDGKIQPRPKTTTSDYATSAQ